MKLNTPEKNNLLFALIATTFSIQFTVIHAFSISLSCNSPCTDIAEDGIPADGVINALWDYTDALAEDTLVFDLQWSSSTSDYDTRLSTKAHLFTIDTTEYIKSITEHPMNGSATLKVPQMYIPPGDYYYIAVSTSTGYPLSELGPYKMNEAFSSYPVPIQERKYNFPVTLCPTDNESCDGSNFIHNADDYLIAKWNFKSNSTVQNARFSLWWGNPANYGTIPYVTIRANNTLWDGEMDQQDIPGYGGEELGPRDQQITFDGFPPPGDSYYVGVYLTVPGGKNEKDQHHMGFSKPFTMTKSRTQQAREERENGSNSVNPMFNGVLLFVSLITLYLCTFDSLS